MARGALRVGIATALFAVVHSALATRTAKAAATRLLGEERRNACYRPFYNLQALVTFGVLSTYIRRTPARTLYHVRGRAALAMRAGQAASLAYAVYTAHQVGIPAMLGLAGIAARRRDAPAPPEPEAQGPVRDGGGGMRATGPFAWSRHPLNFAPLPIFWLFPRMTTRLAAFNVLGSLYLVVGSLHEESRLQAVYGAPYTAYLCSGIPFYLPRPGARREGPLSAGGRAPGHAAQIGGGAPAAGFRPHLTGSTGSWPPVRRRKTRPTLDPGARPDS